MHDRSLIADDSFTRKLPIMLLIEIKSGTDVNLHMGTHISEPAYYKVPHSMAPKYLVDLL